MMLRKFLVSAVAVAGMVSTIAKADADFTSADAAFALRGGADFGTPNAAKTDEALAAYRAILNGSDATNADKVYAASQLARLAIYKGVMSGASSADKEATMRQCWETDIEQISPDKIGGPNRAYYLFQGICLAYWGEEAVNHILELATVIRESSVLKNDIAVLKSTSATSAGDMANAQDFEGGGYGRLAAGVHSNKAAQGVGLYDLAQSVTDIGEALDSHGFQDPTTGLTIDGKHFYENLRGNALVLVAQGKTDEAKTAYKDCVAKTQVDIDHQAVPDLRLPEARWVAKICASEGAAL